MLSRRQPRPRIVSVYNTRHNEWKRKLVQTIEKKKGLWPSRLAILQNRNIQILDDNWNVTHNIRRQWRFSELCVLSNGHIMLKDRDGFDVWDVSNDYVKNIFHFFDRRVPVFALCALSDGRIIYATDINICIVNVETKQEKVIFNSHQIRWFVELKHKKDNVISYSRALNELWLWNVLELTSTKLLGDLDGADVYQIIELSQNQLAILIGGILSLLTITTKEIKYFPHPEICYNFFMIQLSRNRIALGASKNVHIFDIESTTWSEVPCNNSRDLLQLSDGRLVVGTLFGQITIWNIPIEGTPSLSASLHGERHWHCKSITSLVETPDGGLISASKDNTVKYWNLKTCESTFIAHGTNVLQFQLPNDKVEIQKNVKNELDEYLIADLHGIVKDYCL